MTDTSERLDFNRMQWFVAGIVTASLLDRTTSLVLVLSWLVVENKPLPGFLGSHKPQRLIKLFISFCAGKFRRKKDRRTTMVDNFSTPTQVIFTGPIPPLNRMPISIQTIKPSIMSSVSSDS